MYRPRVLIIAELCNPEWTSVPLEGWSHYQALARVTDAHLVTQIRNADALKRAGLVEGRDFTAIDSEKVAGPAHKVGEFLRGGRGRGWTTKMLFNRFGRVYFERLLRSTFEPKVQGGAFEIVHQLTPLSPTLPARFSTVCRLAKIPFVWGPINGGLPWPKGFADVLHAEREWLSKVRGLHRFMPGFRSTRENASAILAGSVNAFEQVSPRYRDKTFYIPENAIDPARFAVERMRATPTKIDARSPLKIAFVGRLVPYKGADMLLDAAEPLLRAGLVTLDVIGGGPQKGALEETIRARAIPNVTLRGEVPHDQLARTLVAFDVFAFPSVREFGGAVALEAMALGVVPIVPNYGGLGELVTDATGYRLPLSTRENLIAAYRERLSNLCDDPSPLVEKSKAAIRRAKEQFTWDAKAASVLKVYDWLLGRSAKPTFEMPIVT